MCGDDDDWLFKSEIIPLSGVSKSGAGVIIQADGAGGWLGTGGVDAQLALIRTNALLKSIKLRFRIGQFSDVFGIQCSNIALACLHFSEGLYC